MFVYINIYINLFGDEAIGVSALTRMGPGQIVFTYQKSDCSFNRDLPCNSL